VQILRGNNRRGDPGSQEDPFRWGALGYEETVWPFTKRCRDASRGQERVRTGHGNVDSAGKFLAWPLYCVKNLDLTDAIFLFSGR
jgi:hypothetical protein